MSGLRRAVEQRLVRAVSTPWVSRLTGRLADARLPPLLLRAAIRAYGRLYRVDWSEVRDPIGSFKTFNAFFVRRLRAGARPRRGVYATLYLSPRMYHRVHSPVDGRIRSWRYLPGRLFPVNDLALPNVEGLFTRNERVAVFLDSEAFGPVAVVLVGATNVGRISLAFTDLVTNVGRAALRTEPSAPISIARGDDLGAFNLGSTVVLLVADRSLRPAAAGERVRMGQALWRKG